jgi:hypothetical protein
MGIAQKGIECLNHLNLSEDNLRWRIKMDKYPDAPSRDGRGRIFTQEYIQKLRKMA